MKRFLYLLIWTLIIGVLVTYASRYLMIMNQKASETFELLPMLIYSTALYIGMGMVLRLPKLILEIKANKPWAFDWVKFISVDNEPSIKVAEKIGLKPKVQEKDKGVLRYSLS